MRLFAVVLDIGWVDQYVSSVWTDRAAADAARADFAKIHRMVPPVVVEFESDTTDGLTDAIDAAAQHYQL